MKLVLFLTLTLSIAQSACFREIDADTYGCVPMKDSKSASQWCEKKYGSEYKAYITDNNCSNELSAILRGESYKPSKSEANKVVEASCLTFEQGMKNGCEYYDYVAAERYCLEKFGNRYIPFIPNNGKCSLKNAAKIRGDANPKDLIKGLESDIKEIETIMTMVDREGLNDSLGGFAHKKPDLQKEFYTDIIKTLMAKMNMFKDDIYQRGQDVKVSMEEVEVLEYLKYSFRYLSVLSRLYKTYAYVAHQNHYVLKTYKFDNLNYLNLKLPKVYGLEILSKVNYKVKSIDNGESLEFLVGEQDKQTYEYMAMQDPESKVDYAKLITYLGIRESITNLWGIQRLTPQDIPNERILSCGNFLSFKMKNTHIKSMNSYTDLLDYDVFYSDYMPRWESLVEATQGLAILSDVSAKNLGFYLFKNVKELKNLLQNEIANPLKTDNELKAQAASDAAMLIMAENQYWEEFSYGHFSTIVMPGDHVRSKKFVIERISKEIFKRRLNAIKEAFIGAYLWVSDKSIKEIENTIETYVNKNLKESFLSKVNASLEQAMQDYNNNSKLALKNRKEKESEILEVTKHSVHGAAILKSIEDGNLNLKSAKLLEPHTLEDLMLLFQNKLDDYEDLRQTLEQNEKFAKELNQFFSEISDEFQKQYVKDNGNGTYKLKGTEEQRQVALRRITVDTARKFLMKFPFKLKDRGASGNLFQKDVITNTGSILSDGSYVAMDNESFRGSFYRPDQYVTLRDKTNVVLPDPKYMFGGGSLNYPSEIPQKTSGFNPDAITTGKISEPLKVVEPGVLKTTRGVTRVDNSKLISLFSQFQVLSNEGQNILKGLAKSDVFPDQIATDNSKEIKDIRFFFLRVFQVLKVQGVSYIANYSGGKFANDEQSQKILAENIVTQAYQSAPILRTENKWKETIQKTCGSIKTGHYQCNHSVERKMPLLYRIASQKFNVYTGKFEVNGAKNLISSTLNNSLLHAGNKASKFCKSNYLNYKNDEVFKDTYSASKFLRASIRTPIGQSEYTITKMDKYDEQIRKDIRGRWEALNEDYFEPSLKYLGMAALIALGVILVIGTGGAATPGVLGGIYAVASTFLAIEFFVSFPLVVGSLYSRINTNFIEVPAQLRFQESLAHSQVDFSKIVDWDMLKDDQKANRSAKGWTIGLMPLDFLYAGMLVRHVRQTTGVIGKNALMRLTGTKLRGFSAPPAHQFYTQRFRDLRKNIGTLGALRVRSAQTVSYLKHFMPKYQPISQTMIKTGSLRIGMARKAQEVGLSQKPWVILEEVIDYSKNLKSKLKNYSRYVEAEARIVDEIRLGRSFKFREVMQHGIEYSSVAYIPKTLKNRFVEAIKTNSIDPITNYFTRFGEVWGSLKNMQGKLVQTRAKNMDIVVDKLQDFQKAVTSGKVKDENLMNAFLKRLSDDEILVLREIAKKSNSHLKNFNSVFKDHKRVISSLRPAAYMFGHPNRAFQHQSTYPQNTIMGEALDESYKAVNDADDLVRYYESMMNQNAPVKMTEEMRALREESERLFGREFKFNSKGEAQAF